MVAVGLVPAPERVVSHGQERAILRMAKVVEQSCQLIEKTSVCPKSDKTIPSGYPFESGDTMVVVGKRWGCGSLDDPL